ncbi:MAG: hypothetical protein FWG65_03305 [Turicibacter sp.]|nr:hypothetical protein [Turicibacter sp.]
MIPSNTKKVWRKRTPLTQLPLLPKRKSEEGLTFREIQRKRELEEMRLPIWEQIDVDDGDSVRIYDIYPVRVDGWWDSIKNRVKTTIINLIGRNR